MTRVRPVLSEADAALIEQIAQLTRTKPTDVVKSAIAVYHWFVRQAISGARIVARKRTGEEVTLVTAELAALEGEGHYLSPEDLGILAKQVFKAKDPSEAVLLRERLTRGFYGI